MTRLTDQEQIEIAPLQGIKRSYGLDCSAMMAVPDHRSGWNYVKALFQEVHKPNGYILVDFVAPASILASLSGSRREQARKCQGFARIQPGKAIISGNRSSKLTRSVRLFLVQP